MPTVPPLPGPADERGPGPDELRPRPTVSAFDLLDVFRDRIEARHLTMAVAGLVAAGLVAWWLLRPPPAAPPELALPMARPAPSLTTPPATAPTVVMVHVTGRVVAPGVYAVDPGARVEGAIEAAGGPSEGADLGRVNLAAPVADGMQIWVPGPDEVPPAVVGPRGPAQGAGGDSSEPAAGPVDLNTAAAPDLEALPGIGPATAAAILSHRDEHGPFASVENLLDVRGIGPAKLESLRPLVAVS